MKYIADFTKVNPSKEAVFILDEGDEILLNNLKKFWTKTKKDGIDVICLTATADDGREYGVEREALEKIGYKIYTNNLEASREPPMIHCREKLDSVNDIIEMVKRQSILKGILIFATGKLYEDLKNEELVEAVTPETKDS